MGLKLETFAPTGSFKWRGVLYRMLQLSDSELRRGVVTASTGNHGFSVGWAAAKLGTPATVVLPKGTPPFKRQRIVTTGARVLVQGGTWNDSLAIARRLAQRDGSTAIEDGEDPVLMAGTATLAVEVLQQVPDVDVVIAPVGGGNLIAALACGLAAWRSNARLVGVQSASARGAYDSWSQHRVLERPVHTIAGGIATTGPVPFAFDILHARVDEMHLVTENALLRAVRDLALSQGVVAEPAAAAPVALLPKIGAQLEGKKAVLILTGRTIEAGLLMRALRS